MAEAKRLSNPPRRIERVVVDVVDVPDTIQITLSIEEARTLRSICGATGGHPTTSRRGYVDHITRALIGVGIASDGRSPYLKGELCFDPENAVIGLT